MSTLQNTQLIEQLMEEYQELGGNLKDLDLYLAHYKDITEAEIIDVLKKEITKRK